MTTKQILKGLKFRLETLEEGYKVLEPKEEVSNWLKRDYEVRIEELESLIYWIEGKSGN